MFGASHWDPLKYYKFLTTKQETCLESIVYQDVAQHVTLILQLLFLLTIKTRDNKSNIINTSLIGLFCCFIIQQWPIPTSSQGTSTRLFRIVPDGGMLIKQRLYGWTKKCNFLFSSLELKKIFLASAQRLLERLDRFLLPVSQHCMEAGGLGFQISRRLRAAFDPRSTDRFIRFLEMWNNVGLARSSLESLEIYQTRSRID